MAVTKPTIFGPFRGGENNRSGAENIADTEVALASNFDFSLDGSLQSRPAIVLESATPVGGQFVDILGYYVRNDGRTFAVCTTDALTWVYDLSAQTWTQIWTSKAASFTQYDNKIVMISESVSGGYWEAGAFTATATMPLGSQIVFYQDRFWAFGPKGTANQNTVWFSDLTVISPPSTIYNWTVATNFFIVGPGDGQWISAMRADPSALLIFRNLSTWSFQFPSSPALGTLRRLSSTIGTDAVFSVVPYENYYFVLNQGYLYQFINYQYYPLNSRKIAFARTALVGAARRNYSVGVLGSRIIVWYLGSTYVYNVVTATWSEWDSPTTRAALFLQAPPDATLGDSRVAYATTGDTDLTKAKLFRIQEAPLPTGAGEMMTCVLKTKAYALDGSSRFKRQTHWVAEVSTALGITGILHPSALPAAGVTWDQMAAATWDTLALGSWDSPLVVLSVTSDVVSFPAAQPTRLTIKLVKDIREQRMQYEIRGNTTGRTADAPFRIFFITAYLIEKATTEAKVS